MVFGVCGSCMLCPSMCAAHPGGSTGKGDVSAVGAPLLLLLPPPQQDRVTGGAEAMLSGCSERTFGTENSTASRCPARPHARAHAPFCSTLCMTSGQSVHVHIVDAHLGQGNCCVGAEAGKCQLEKSFMAVGCDRLPEQHDWVTAEVGFGGWAGSKCCVGGFLSIGKFETAGRSTGSKY